MDLADALDWTEISFEARFLGKYGEQDSVAIRLSDGDVEEVAAPVELWLALQRMRSHMYEPGEGTWFGISGVMQRTGYLDMHFDYGEPRWRIPLGAPTFQEELEKFPREQRNIPSWFVLAD
ncbi:hypothetical protein [Pseudarthrobacter sp. efr-133-R2A-89]|uniref:hypothetical protein n=1 Tax=Pseudarthrobacter sp. efr-133-R2A-89 TaxID=3040302 RepID=UPI002557AF44|nr:hypothetical protein [Pseudarthrobacter sp. efr-133-R2A-89]